ncbi:MAG: hypothetical protein JRN09_00475 [Nitrososphaerota archaeon]|nr:hypothetical protein [Nitrososphaerota archaeon]
MSAARCRLVPLKVILVLMFHTTVSFDETVRVPSGDTYGVIAIGTIRE